MNVILEMERFGTFWNVLTEIVSDRYLIDVKLFVGCVLCLKMAGFESGARGNGVM
jgi:hypothetical protein